MKFKITDNRCKAEDAKRGQTYQLANGNLFTPMKAEPAIADAMRSKYDYDYVFGMVLDPSNSIAEIVTLEKKLSIRHVGELTLTLES